MDNRQIIETAFDNEIKRVFAEKTDVRNWLINHERKKVCIDNLEKEIKLIEWKDAITLDKSRIEMVSQDFARVFAKASLGYVEEQRKTDLQKSIERQKAEEVEAFEKMLDEEVSAIDRSEEIG